MMKHRARPALCRILIPALVASAVPVFVAAAPSAPKKPDTSRTADTSAPTHSAQAQIARLRQTADQLRLLSHQPHPTNAAPTEHDEHARHRQWLHEAGQRVRTLADNWEQRLQPAPRGKKGATRPSDLNSFFAAQTAGLQSRLDRESAATEYRSPLVRAARDTARVVIGQMN